MAKSNDHAGAEIADLIFDGLAKNQDRNNRPHLGCSIIGRSCERQIWYVWRWAKIPDHDGRLLRIFRRGDQEEPNVEADLKRIGIDVMTEDPRSGKQFGVKDMGNHLRGSLDGLIRNIPNDEKEWYVLEIKTSGSKFFTKLVKELVKKAKPEHYAQMQLYMRLTNIKKALYIAVNKDTDKIHSEFIDYNKDEAEEYYQKSKRIFESKEAPPKISEHSSWFECKMCDHREHCHGENVAEVNCRTCIHATPIVSELDLGDKDGVWKCAKKDEILSLDDQKLGCDQHLFIPNMISFASPIDADQGESKWIEYKSEQSVHIFNCTADTSKEGGYTSKEMQRAGSRILTDDPLVESIIKNFSGKLEI
tara:strand:+ start:81 stop:1166 length:1086 start_codon:yes stop_codon:yes gene_type:complete